MVRRRTRTPVAAKMALATLGRSRLQSAHWAVTGTARREGYAAASEQLADTAIAVPYIPLSVEVLTGTSSVDAASG
jgi:hypothetical protein